MLLEGLEGKATYLNGLREQIRKHRSEDFAQLSEAQQQAQFRWDERLRRLEEWMASGTSLGHASEKLSAWRTSVIWFDHALEIGNRFAAALDAKAARYEKQLTELTQQVQQWLDRLILKEVELKEFIQRQATKGTEILISSARKRPYLDFVYVEREEEGRLARAFKTVRGAANHSLDRFARAEKWAAERVTVNPGYFEIQKNQVLDAWRQPQKRFQTIREGVLEQALSFEEGRRRLREIYEIVQRMRVVQETPPRPRPLLERLFNKQDS